MKFDINEIQKACNSSYIDDMKVLEILSKLPKKRTNPQNRALHLFCKMISDKLNDQGQTFRYTGFKGFEIETTYSMTIVKDFLWKPIQKTLYDDDSTTILTNEKITTITNIINKFLAENFEIYVGWPSYENKFEENQ